MGARLAARGWRGAFGPARVIAHQLARAVLDRPDFLRRLWGLGKSYQQLFYALAPGHATAFAPPAGDRSS